MSAFEGVGAFGADLQQHAGVAGDGVDFLDLGALLDCQQGRGLAPAGGVDMDEGEQRLAESLGIDQRRHAADGARAPQALDALVGGGRGKADAFAEVGVADGGIVDQDA